MPDGLVSEGDVFAARTASGRIIWQTPAGNGVGRGKGRGSPPSPTENLTPRMPAGKGKPIASSMASPGTPLQNSLVLNGNCPSRLANYFFQL